MIKVSELTRRFSGVTAVDSISFSVDKGEIVGFLGPNGAGKTTTLRMLTCFLPPTSGSAEIAGFEITESPLSVRRSIGYLPENVPLYLDMRVAEYLRFRAGVKGVRGSAVQERIRRVCEQCRIGDVRDRIIGHLSKGFRQRVGMADALIHDPPILFLDEPTSGLDPNQIREVRDLISGLGREKTILISTHILPEVEATCKRVIIIDKGRIAADGKLDQLRSQGVKGQRIAVKGSGAPEAEMLDAIRKVEGVASAEHSGREGGMFFIVVSEGGSGVGEGVYRLFASRGWSLSELRHERMRLEEVFWKVTGFAIGGHAAGGPEGQKAKEEGK